jgi:hypothetical protein
MDKLLSLCETLLVRKRGPRRYTRGARKSKKGDKKMPAVTKGSEKQIAWATTIVEQEVARLDRMLAPIPPKEERSEIFQKLYGEEIAFVKAVRNTLEKRVQSAKFVIDTT